VSDQDYSRPQIETPGLDDFLESGAPRRLIGEEGRAFWRACFRPDAPVAPPEELHPHRVMALWRITRFALRAIGRLAEDERLFDATERLEPDPWEFPVKPLAGASPPRYAAALLAHVTKAGGAPIICPSEPLARAHWCDVAALAAKALALDSHPVGEAGVTGLCDPKTAALCCPTKEQLLAFEESFLGEVSRLIVQKGQPDTISHLCERYGFARGEAVGYAKLVRAEIAAEEVTDIEDARSFLSAHLLDYLARIKDTANMRDELAALKLYGMIHGVTRGEVNDENKIRIAVINQISSERDDSKLLPGDAEVIDAEYDQPALEDFDKENRNA